jgi:hypothetical protein
MKSVLYRLKPFADGYGRRLFVYNKWANHDDDPLRVTDGLYDTYCPAGVSDDIRLVNTSSIRYPDGSPLAAPLTLQVAHHAYATGNRPTWFITLCRVIDELLDDGMTYPDHHKYNAALRRVHDSEITADELPGPEAPYEAELAEIDRLNDEEAAK